MERRWIAGNHFNLLENGEEFFPRVFACIANAKKEVLIETFILFEDKVGLQLQDRTIRCFIQQLAWAMCDGAQRPRPPSVRHPDRGQGQARSRARRR